MNKVIFFCNWMSSSTELLNRYKLMTPNNSGIWNNLIGTNKLDEADIVIFMDGIPTSFNLSLIKDKFIICFPREPNTKKNWIHLDIKYNYTYDNIYTVVTNPQFIQKDYDFLKNLKYKQAEKKFSAIISNKSNGNGYKLRRKFLIDFANKFPGVCDIYGKGWSNELGISYKGELDAYHVNSTTTNSKYDGLINYNYSLCIENCSKKNYFTEKITDAILCWTIPIYYGCTNICDYLPHHSYYFIDINKPGCLVETINIINKPITKENIDAMNKARELILNKYNIWPTIENISVAHLEN
jgi:hypothetical protein